MQLQYLHRSPSKVWPDSLRQNARASVLEIQLIPGQVTIFFHIGEVFMAKKHVKESKNNKKKLSTKEKQEKKKAKQGG